MQKACNCIVVTEPSELLTTARCRRVTESLNTPLLHSETAARQQADRNLGGGCRFLVGLSRAMLPLTLPLFLPPGLDLSDCCCCCCTRLLPARLVLWMLLPLSCISLLGKAGIVSVTSELAWQWKSCNVISRHCEDARTMKARTETLSGYLSRSHDPLWYAWLVRHADSHRSLIAPGK